MGRPKPGGFLCTRLLPFASLDMMLEMGIKRKSLRLPKTEGCWHRSRFQGSRLRRFASRRFYRIALSVDTLWGEGAQGRKQRWGDGKVKPTRSSNADVVMGWLQLPWQYVTDWEVLRAEIHFLTSWRLEVWGQGLSWVGFLRPLSLAYRWLSPCVFVHVLIFSSSGDTSRIGLGPILMTSF